MNKGEVFHHMGLILGQKAWWCSTTTNNNNNKEKELRGLFRVAPICAPLSIVPLTSPDLMLSSSLDFFHFPPKQSPNTSGFQTLGSHFYHKKYAKGFFLF